MLSSEQIKEYRKNKGKICPYCGKSTVENINGKLNIISQDRSIQEMQCSSCKKMWKEIYPIFDIEEIENIKDEKNGKTFN